MGFGQDPSLTPGFSFHYFPLPFRPQPSLILTSHVPQLRMISSILSPPLLRAHLWLPPTQRKAKVLTIGPHFPPDPHSLSSGHQASFQSLELSPQSFCTRWASAGDTLPRYLHGSLSSISSSLERYLFLEASPNPSTQNPVFGHIVYSPFSLAFSP